MLCITADTYFVVEEFNISQLLRDGGLESFVPGEVSLWISRT